MPNSEISTLPEVRPVSQTEVVRIPPTQSQVEALKEDADIWVKFSFKDYNTNLCQIHKLSGAKDVKYVTSELKTASTMPLSEFKDILKPITNAGTYSQLFNGLDRDAEMSEIKCSGTRRVFGYLAQGIYSIVAITSSHFETKKNFR